MRQHLKPVFSLLTLTVILILPYFVFAAGSDGSMLGNLQTVAGLGGYSTDPVQSDLMTVVGRVIQAALGLLGAIFLIIMVVAGYSWMTASGNESKVEKAQSMIKRAIIGLIITLSSYAIWTFIFDSIIKKAGKIN